jgi:elongator complex protein 1
MRNLRNVYLRESSVPQHLQLSAVAWDATDDSVVCTFGPTETSPTIHLMRKESGDAAGESNFKTITSWDAPCPLHNLACDEVISLQYFPDTTTSCLVLAGGDLIEVRENQEHGGADIEIVGSVDAQVAAAAWAPDEELLALITCADTLILMTRNFEPVTDRALTAEDLKASKYVSVGWGKKETQFQGKRAKALRDPTVPEIVEKGELSPYDKNGTRISWRGDGAFLAVNRLVASNRRAIRVFTREGNIDSASEPVDGLESALSWRPAGNLITGIQRIGNHLNVIFFERNGLRHGEFPLRLSNEDMRSWGSDVALSWNIDSSTLAVSFRDRIQLWTMNNYHYYLKQEVLLNGALLAAAQPCLWHPEKPLRLAMTAASMGCQCGRFDRLTH